MVAAVAQNTVWNTMYTHSKTRCCTPLSAQQRKIWKTKGAGGISSVSAFAFDGTSIERFGQGVKYQT